MRLIRASLPLALLGDRRYCGFPLSTPLALTGSAMRVRGKPCNDSLQTVYGLLLRCFDRALNSNRPRALALQLLVSTDATDRGKMDAYMEIGGDVHGGDLGLPTQGGGPRSSGT